MPPEATDAINTKYHTALDIFSFGHLSLFTMTQVFPLPTSATYKDPITGKIMGYTEIERRKEFMEILKDILTESHPIVTLIIQCLDYDPAKRPLASEILERLRAIGPQTSPSHSGIMIPTPSQRMTLEHSVSSDHFKLLKYPWFHGALSRDNAVSRLQSHMDNIDGAYLVRCSPHHPYSIVLTMYAMGKSMHYRISQTEGHDGVTIWYSIADGPKFSRMNLLLRHYSIKRGRLPICLDKFCPRPSAPSASPEKTKTSN